MNKFTFLLLIFTFLFSCNSDEKASSDKMEGIEPGETVVTPAPEKIGGDEEVGFSDVFLSKEVLNTSDLPDPKPDDVNSFLTTEQWKYMGGMFPGLAQKREFFDERYIKFFTNNKYHIKQAGAIVGEGNWRISKNILYLESTNVNSMDSEWTITTKGHSLVMAGTTKFNNNHTQYKLGRVKFEASPES